MSISTEYKLSIREYFSKNRYFYIPPYQRGYKWGVPLPDNSDECAVSILIEDIKRAIKQDEYFIQGVTVSEDEENIVLIDGQQRTTTFFLILLELLSEEEKRSLLMIKDCSKLKYSIREDSQKFIDSLLGLTNYPKDANEYQDTFYFQKCINTVKTKISIEEKEMVKRFILDKVKLFYIPVDKKKAPQIFNMLNGVKAFMRVEELVKADLLNKSSRVKTDKEKILSLTEEWEVNQLRGQYAREWDRWMYFWNREDVRKFYNSGTSPMGLLIEYFYKNILAEGNKKINYRSEKENIPSQFRRFQSEFLSEAVVAKKTFLELRKLQKRFEDLYEDPVSYNYLGITLKCSGIDYYTVLRYFLNNYKDKQKQKKYCYYSLVRVTDKEIIDNNEEAIINKVQEMITRLKEPFVYCDEENSEFQDGRKYDAFKQLLRLNVEEDNNLNSKKGRKFIFSAWNEKSLEHIHPKSKVNKIIEGKLVRCLDNMPNDKMEEGYLSRESMLKKGITEHSIGNLVLLYKDNNSQFSDKSFEEKKAIYFGLGDEGFKSRSLIHSILVFSKGKWDEETIKTNQQEIINRIEKDYGYENGKWKTL